MNVIPVTRLGAQIQLMKGYPELIDQDITYREWCRQYHRIVEGIVEHDQDLPKVRLPYTERTKEEHFQVIRQVIGDYRLEQVQADDELLLRSTLRAAENRSKKTQSNWLYDVAWYILYLFLTQYGIRWEHYFKVRERARILNTEDKYHQNAFRALLFYDPKPLLKLRHELVAGLRRMQPFMNFLIRQCLIREWKHTYTATDRRARNYNDYHRILNGFTSDVLVYWLDLAMRIVNVPWSTGQLQDLVLFEPSGIDEVPAHVPCMYMKSSQDGEEMPQFFREWQVKSKVERESYLGERVRYSLGYTISFYMWFYWEYGYQAESRPYRAYVREARGKFVLQAIDERKDEEEGPIKFLMGDRNKRITSKQREFIRNHMGLSADSLHYFEAHNHYLCLFLQYVAMAGHFWRIDPNSTKMHAWVEMNDMTLAIDNEFYTFWQVHYKQMRGMEVMKSALQTANEYRLELNDVEKRREWIDLAPIPRELINLARDDMNEFTPFMN